MDPEQAKATFQHILQEVLHCDTTTPLYKVLEGSGYDNDISLLHTLTEEEIQGLHYPLSRTSDEQRNIRTYVAWKDAKGEGLTLDTFCDVEPKDFAAFCMGPYLRTNLGNLFPPDGGPSKSSYTPAELFRKSVK